VKPRTLRQPELSPKHEQALTALAQSFPGFLSDLVLEHSRNTSALGN
jgi:hypothetical protein